MKPIIGITPLYDEEKESIWMLPGYLEGILESGGIPIILPFSRDEKVIDQVYNLCNGILLTGGQDIDPSLYHHVQTAACGKLYPDKDFLETHLFRKAYQDNKSILGICRGLHLINALLGGSLHQDLDTNHRPDKKMKHLMTAPYNRQAHQVNLINGTPLQELLNKSLIPVNSYHHQGIDDLARGLKAMAVAEDGLIEAVYDPGKAFVWGLQWHPEFLIANSQDQPMIFKAFVAAASGE
ncbi:gamma-glutamyl-gamma-aminobutyrate hydrolase family protein [Eubacteriaceae bacterium ES2]|nr:gamma-glutamyl-gamma-aminobutyrate hydrolase family protein [Eubacteriaceae bacterium ES2]